MKKIYYFSNFLVVVLFVCILNQSVFAQDRHNIAPVLSDDSISVFPSQTDKTDLILIAQSSQSTSEDDLSDEDLFKEYDDKQTSLSVADPLYYFNYAMYSFNDFLYFAAIKPLATGYKTIIPTPVRKGVNNFFHNLLFPVRFVNNLLQGEIKDAGTEIGVFLINTTAGVLGFVQVAQDDFDLQTSNEDLGQTLGSYTIGNGFYLVLPILGPSTLRDTVGLVGDSFLTPVNYVDPWELSTGIKVYDSINAASFRIGDYEALKQAAIDPYAAIKDAYIQNRIKKVKE